MNSPDNLRVVYAGTPDFAVPALKALHASGYTIAAVYTQPDRPAGRGRKVKPGPVKQAALDLGLPVEQPVNFKEPESIARLESFAADVLVVAAYGLILPKAVLDLPRHGCLNIHASLLPRWRGAAPIQRALLAGDATSGASIMVMEEGLDTGPVIATCEIPLHADMTAAELHDRVAEEGAEALVAVLPAWCRGEQQAIPQNDADVTYAEKLQKPEATIDWAEPALNIQRKVMAFNPWPVAQSAFDAERMLRIWKSSIPSENTLTELHQAQPDVAPGSLQVVASERLFVMCGDGLLELLEVQLPGRKAMPVTDFLKSNQVDNHVLGVI